MSASPTDLADALIRMFGQGAVRQARDNAASNARAGDVSSEKMWLAVAAIVTDKLSALRRAGPR
ncbi:MAG TPA: hypothetical protein VHZ32_16860 [Rhizomicrobium sp.]|nr:hypothetical protein [Rhizomicrobium sp.]